jgi:ABC-type transport system involved in cytochrome c biogenesis permease subunit
MQRSILIGAAIGLYYGIFYKPSDVDPDYGIAIVLSIFAALITVVVRFWKKKQPYSVIIKNYFEMLLLYSVFLLSLAARHLAEQMGGRYGVVLFTTLIGICLGYFMATRKKII